MTNDNQTSGDKANDELDHAHDHAEPKGVSEQTGEDEGSTANEGNEDHLKPDQKTTSR
jgi:hypothetical protein